MLLTILYLFIVPLLVVLAAKKWPIIEKISPMVVLYIIGLIVGNVGIMGEKSLSVCTNVSNVVVLISIPLMLLGCDFRNWSAKTVLKTFLVGLFSILIVTVAGFFIFRGQAVNAELSTEDFARVSAAMTGIYTGGIPNFAPVSKAVNLPQHLFLMVSGYDLVVTGLYLIFIVFAGRSIVRWCFPAKKQYPTLSEETEPTSQTETVTKSQPFWRKIMNHAAGIGVAIVLVAASYGLSLLLPLENTTAVIIITLTTLSILLSFWKPVKRLEGTFDVGLYFVYVFCLAVATMVNIHDLEFSKYLFILYYIAFAVFGSLVLQILFARLFKIDGDMTLAASIALINSPPFVPMVSAVLHNKDIILPGIAIGLLGYAVGNYLGIGIFMFLSAI
jgi:uncharacterized membrane protein